MSWSSDPKAVLLQTAQAQFDALDVDGSGYIEPWELKAALQQMGLNVTGDDVAESLVHIGLGPEDAIDRATWMTLCVSDKELISRKQRATQETVQVFQALGGDYEDEATGIDTEKLNDTLKGFGIEADVQKLVEDMDTDKSKVVEYNKLDAFLKDTGMLNSDLNDPDNPYLRNSLEELQKIKEENAWIEPKSRSKEMLHRRRTENLVQESDAVAADKDPFGRLRWLEQLEKSMQQHQKNQRKLASAKLRAVLEPDRAAALAKKKQGWGSTMASHPAKRPPPSHLAAGFRRMSSGKLLGMGKSPYDNQKRRPSSIGLGVNAFTFGRQDVALTSQEWRQYLETPAPNPSNMPMSPPSPRVLDKAPKKRSATAGQATTPKPKEIMPRSSSVSSLTPDLKERPQTSIY